MNREYAERVVLHMERQARAARRPTADAALFALLEQPPALPLSTLLATAREQLRAMCIAGDFAPCTDDTDLMLKGLVMFLDDASERAMELETVPQKRRAWWRRAGLAKL